MPAVTISASPPTVRRLLASIPAILAGRAPDPLRIADAVARRIGTAALALIRAAFAIKSAGGTGADGVRWQGRKRRKGAAGRADAKRPILVRSGRLRAGLVAGRAGSVVRVGRGRVEVGLSVPYAAHHQSGTERMPARPLWPQDGTLPLAWRRALTREARDAIAAVVAGLLARGAVR